MDKRIQSRMRGFTIALDSGDVGFTIDEDSNGVFLATFVADGGDVYPLMSLSSDECLILAGAFENAANMLKGLEARDSE